MGIQPYSWNLLHFVIFSLPFLLLFNLLARATEVLIIFY